MIPLLKHTAILDTSTAINGVTGKQKTVALSIKSNK